MAIFQPYLDEPLAVRYRLFMSLEEATALAQLLKQTVDAPMGAEENETSRDFRKLFSRILRPMADRLGFDADAEPADRPTFPFARQ